MSRGELGMCVTYRSVNDSIYFPPQKGVKKGDRGRVSAPLKRQGPNGRRRRKGPMDQKDRSGACQRGDACVAGQLPDPQMQTGMMQQSQLDAEQDITG